MNKRRRLVIAFGLAGFSAYPSGAQEKKRLPRIGVLFIGTASSTESRLAALTEGFSERGLIDGKTATITIRYGDGSLERLRAQAAELARERMDVIVAASNTGTEAVTRVTPSTPIVCVTCGDYVKSGFAASLSRPGGNITGTTIISPELTQKRIQLLREIVPKLQRMAFLTVPDIDRSVEQRDREVEETGAKLGIETRAFINQGAGAFEQLETHLRAWRPEGILIMDRGPNMQYRNELGDLAMRLKLPLIAGAREYSEAGALVSYGPQYDALYRRAAFYVDRILKGTKPGDLPIEQPTRFELVVNMKVAKALGITIPQTILVWTDRVIE